VVTLVHGGVFHSGPAWAGTIGPLVQEGYRVIAVDRRGYGRSPEGNAYPVTVGLQAEDVATTLELRDVADSHLVGVSYGALVCLELALQRPELVMSLTLIEPTIFAWLEDDPDYAQWVDRFAELETRAATGNPPQTWLSEWLSLIDPAMARSLKPGSPAWPLVERSQDRRWKEESVLLYRPDEQALEALGVPTLIVNGSESEPALHAVGEMLADRIPGAIHVTMPEAGHQLHAERSATFNDLLARFLAQSPGPLEESMP
jgi:pimeloyl-ACP methyl ester carboxylesterase